MNSHKVLFKNIRIFIIILVGIALLALLGLYGLHLYQKHHQAPISMIIATDMHYISPDYIGDGAYFGTPSSTMDGKLINYSDEIIDAFISEVLEKKPQILLLSGDLTLNGSVKSHDELVEKLKTLQEAGIAVLVIPGNHDVNTPAGDYSGDEIVPVESYTGSGFLDCYENFGPARALSRDEESFSYIYEATPYLRILMLDSNCNRKGYVLDSTLKWMEQELRNAKRDGAEVLVVSHQNLYAHSELLSFSYQFYNADQVLPLFEKYDVICNLSGHIHVQSIMKEKVPEISTASLAIHNAQYGMLTYDGKTLDYTVCQTDVEAYAKAIHSTDENLLNFNQYSRWYFEEVARQQVYSKYTESELPKKDVDLLAETFAKINSAYFVGETIDTDALAEGIALWRMQTDNFILKYIENMLEEAGVNNRSLTIDLR